MTAVADTEAPPRRRRWRRLLVVLLVLGLLLGLLVGLAVWRVGSYFGQVDRLPGALPAAGVPRPAENAGGSETFLLLGSDRRAEAPTTGEEASDEEFVPGAQRTDVIMLAQLSGDRQDATVVSLPRDSWVEIPGHGMNKINAAYSIGGSPLLVQTIEQLTDVRVDHVAVIDFEGFRTITTELGGVDVRVAETSTNPRTGTTFPAGINHLEGEQALDFVRQRYGLPGGDLDRVRRQQAVLRAILAKTASTGTLANPLKLDGVLTQVTQTVSVDDTLSSGDLRSLAFSSRDLRTENVAFVTAPTAGLGTEGAQSVVYLDQTSAQPLWDAIRTDQTGPTSVAIQRLGGAVR